MVVIKFQQISSVISVFLLICVAGGIFLTCNHFTNAENDIKDYWILISVLLISILLSCQPRPLEILKQSLDSKVFVSGIIIIAFLFSLYGLLQQFGYIDSNNAGFKITGPYENPAGFAIVQTLMFPLCLYYAFTNKWLAKVSSILIALTVVLCGSRTGILSLLAITVIVVCNRTNAIHYLLQHKYLSVFIVILSLFLFVELYLVKMDSANGRLYIWRICWTMIKDKPLFGFGPYGVYSHYMDYQAQYFELNQDSVYSWLADDISHPFNEYIKLAVNYGIIGLVVAIFLLIVVVCRILTLESKKRCVLLSYVAGIVIFSQFSYPFDYSITWFVVGIIIILLLPEIKNYLSKDMQIVLRAIVSIFAFIAICVSVRMMYLDIKWKEMSDLCLQGKTYKMLPYYAKMKPEKENDERFLYNYSAELNIAGMYEASMEIIEEYIDKRKDYDVQLLLADNYINMGDTINAIEAYNKAANMIPCRFVPLGCAMVLYDKICDTTNAYRLARTILDKPIKVNSETIEYFIIYAKGILEMRSMDLQRQF